MLKSIKKNKIKILKLNRYPKYFILEKEKLLKKKKEEIALYRQLKEEIKRRRGKKTKRSQEGIALKDY